MTPRKSKCEQFLIFLTLSFSSILVSAHAQITQSLDTPHSSLQFLDALQEKLKQGHAVLELGYYWSIEGEQQHINIRGLIGDEFTVTNAHNGNGVLGVGYFLEGPERTLFKINYGINAFYLATTSVTGNVVQENLFTNLSYKYDVTHFPVFAMAKTTIKTSSPKYGVIIDGGIGPNFMHVGNFQEYPLDQISLPDSIFTSHTTTTFSATIGLSVVVNQFFGRVPLQCGYRFFYLGQGQFNQLTSQVMNTLNTGNSYGNAVMCSVTI